MHSMLHWQMRQKERDVLGDAVSSENRSQRHVEVK